MSIAMNLTVLALMLGITALAAGLVVYAVQDDHPLLLVVLACIGAAAFAPWHRWR